MKHQATPITLLSNVTAPGDGRWFDISNLADRKSIHISLGVGGGTVQLMVSNAPNKPADIEDGVQVGGNISVSGFAYLDYPYRWAKLKPTVAIGPINAWLYGHAERIISGQRNS